MIIVEIESGKIAHDFGEQAVVPDRLVFSPDGKQLASLVDRKLQRFDLNTGIRLPSAPGEKLIQSIAAIQFTPDGKTLAIANKEMIYICDATTGEERRRIPFRAFSPRARKSRRG